MTKLKLFSLLMLLFVGIGHMWGDSYTIAFKSTSGSDGSQAQTTIANLISSGDSYVSSVSATKCYNGKSGYGIKIGASSGSSSIVLNLSSDGQVKPTKVTINACRFGSDTGNMNVTLNNGSATTKTLTNSLADYECTMDGNTTLTKITIAPTTKRIYVTSITVEYAGGGSDKPTVSFDPVAGTYCGTQNVELSSSVADATIYYTTDGTTPSTSSSVYSSAISVSTNTTIKAFAKKDSNTGDVAQAAYTINTPEDPMITFNNGSVDVGQNLNLSTLFTSNSEGAVTYSITAGGSYASLDGSTLSGVAVGSVTVQASQAANGCYNAKTTTATITVQEHVVNPGEYDIVPNNALWGTSFNGSVSGDESYSGSQHDITLTYAKGTGSYRYINDSQTRFYPNNNLTISVPSGYVITSVVFTGSTWPNSMSANVGTMTDSKNWSGKSQSITFTGGGSSNNNQCTKITVTYEAIAPEVTVDPTSLSFDAKQNIAVAGKTFTLTGANLTSGLTLAASEGFTVSPTSLTAEAAMADGGAEVTVTPATPTATTTPVEGTVTISGGGLASNVGVNLSMAVTPTYLVALAVNDNTMGSATLNGGTASIYVTDDEEIALVATPESGHEFVNWTVSDDDIVLDDENAASTTALAAAAGTITANFQAQACTGLAAPVLDEVTTTYQSATIAWEAVANADGYVLNLKKHVGNVAVVTDEVIVAPAVSFEKTGLEANTQYDYTVMAAGNGTTYCDESNPLLEGNFTTNDYPSVAVTYSENGNSVSGGTKQIMNAFALPDEVTNEISGKTFVGWTTKSDFEDGDQSDAETYFAKGTNFTIQSNAAVTLFAVYATATPGEDVEALNEDFASISTGNSTSSSGSGTNWTPNSNFNSTKNAVYQAGGAIRLGKSGSITTKALDLSSGAVTVSFKLKGWSASENTITVQVDEQDTQNATCSGYMSTGDFESKSLTFAAGTEESVVKFTTSSNVRVFVDEIVVSVAGNVTYSDYVISGSAPLPQLAAPTGLTTGTYYEAQTITLTATNDADIYYTLDGSAPTKSSTKYTAPFSVDATKTIKAIAAKEGFENSEAAVATYTIGKTFASVSDLFTYLEAQSLTSLNNVKVTGLVSRITTAWDEEKGYLTYYISDNGQAANELQMYRGAGTGAATLAVGDQVTVTGNYTYFQSTTHEFAAGNTIVERTAATLASVTIGGTAEKTAYSPQDNEFSRAGLTATATYNTGYTKDVTADATWTNDLTNNIVEATGDVAVTATYGDKSDTKNVGVTYTSKTLDHITLSYTSIDTYVGMALPTPTVRAFYVEEIADEDVTEQVAAANGFDTESAYNGSEAGSYTINVSYTLGEETKTAEYTVTVKVVYNDESEPYTVAKALEIIEALFNTTTPSADSIVVAGKVSRLDGTYYNTYWISDDGGTDNELEVYSGKYLNNVTFTEYNQLHVGDEVVVKGKVKTYKSTMEFDSNSRLVSLLREPEFEISDVASFEVGTPDLAVADLTITKDGEGEVTLASSDLTEYVTIEDGKLHAVAEGGPATITANLAANGIYKAASTTFEVTVIPAQTRYTVTFDLADGSADPTPSLGNQLEGANVEIPAGTYTKDGYKFNGWAVERDDTHAAVEVTEAAGVYSFSMPAANVTITAQWVEGSDFTWDASQKGYTNAQDIATATEEADPISIVFAKETAQNGPKYYTSGTAVRTYAGNTVTIATKSDTKLINKITFTYGDKNVVADGLSEDKLTWTGLAKKVVLTTSGGQAHYKTINVTYINGTVTTLAITDINLRLSDGETALNITKNVDATIIYEGLDESVATITGNAVTPVAEGSTTVTARIAQGANYTAAETEFTITVAAKTIPEMSFPQAEYNANLDESFTAPTLTKPEGVTTVHYNSSNDAAVSVDENTGAITLNAEGTAVITATSEENNDYGVGTASYTLHVIDPNKDVLTASAINVTSYGDGWGEEKTFGSGVKYIGNSTTGTGDQSGTIQLRKDQGSGIVTTSAKGYLKSISATATKNGNNNLYIYAKSTAYESASDLHDADKRGEFIGTISKDGGALVFDGTKSYADNYKYIGIKANGGAVYYDDITITWTPAEFTSYNVTYIAGEGTGEDVVESIEEGSLISLKAADTFEAPEGKMFAGWLLEGEENAREAGSKFTVMAAATFTAQWVNVYTITYVAGEGTGEDVVVENVQAGDYELAENTFTAPENKEFAGWKLNNEGDLLAAGSNYVVGANASFTAQWSIVKQEAGLAYATTSYMITRGREFEKPELTNPHTLAVTYSGNNDEVATVDAATGALTLKGVVGEVTVTATSAETEYYYAGEASYTLKVKDANLSGGWERLTNSSTLVDGMKVIIAQHVTEGTAIKTMGAQKTNNRDVVAGSLEEDVLVADEGTEILTMVAVGENTFAFKTANNKYLYAASSTQNYLKSQDKIDDNATWTIVLSADGKATITAQGEYTHKVMRYNSGSSLFSCYTGNQQDIAIYSKTVAVNSGTTSASSLDEYADVVVADGATLVIDAGTKPLGNITGNVEVNAPLQAEGVHLGVNNTMTVNSTVNVPSFSISVQLGSTGQATNVNVDPVNGSIAAPEGYVDMALSDDANPDHWHSFTVPFKVDALTGIYDAETGAKLANEVNYAIMVYDGEVRANGKYGWKKYRGTLQPGTFYLLTIDGASKVLRFMKKEGSYVAGNSMEMTYHSGSGALTDYGWCGVGNQNMFNGYVPSQYTAQVLNATGDGYQTINANQALSACIPFFIQVTITVDLVMNTSDPSTAPRRTAAKGVEKVQVTFGNEAYTDNLYISASEDATNQYEIGKDLLKMTITNTPNVPQIFGNAYGNKLCMVDAPMVNDRAEYSLTLYAPQAGEYTISAPAMENADLYLTYEGAIIWNLSMGEFVADFAKGNNEGYGLLLKAKMPQTPTGIESTEHRTQSTDVQKVIIDENVFILRGGQMYDVTGKMVK